MAIDVIKILKSGKAYSGLSETDLRKLVGKLDKIYLHKGENVFVQGGESDGVFLLLTGKLMVVLKKDKYIEKIVSIVHPGETVGEMGAFSREPRTTTVKAIENSILLKLKSDDFRELCNQHPLVIIQAMNTLAKRSFNIIETLSQDKLTKKHIAMLPANDSAAMQKFEMAIIENLHNLPDIVILSDYDTELNKKYPTESELTKYIHELIDNEKIIIYLLSLYETPLSRVCFEYVDIIYVVGNGIGTAEITGFIRQKISESVCMVKPELILLYENNGHRPINTNKWLKLIDFRFHHHVRMNNQEDWLRILRFIQGKAVGLVLGGGGVRSWAHMGVIKALTELKVPIDFIGGASGGSIVGGYYALHETYKDPHEALHALSVATSKTVSFWSLTWPVISIFDSKHFTTKLQNVFGKVKIENLWLPFFSVACNLAKNSAVIQRRGMLWEKIRSSTSIPGVFPPVVSKGQIYLDGGIANNLPVELMKKISDSIKTIIAVELIHNVPDEKGYNFPPILPFWKVLLSKLRLGYKSYKFPNFIDTFLKSLLVGSSVKQLENSLAADILIKPDLSKFHLLNITYAEEQELIEIGYNATIRVFKKIKWDELA